MELLHPGVYIQEVPGGARPIEGVSTSTAAFLGKAAMGPVDRPVLVTSFTEFERQFGTFLNDGFLAHAALQFFNNGGRRLYVGRVARGAAAAAVTIADRKSTPVQTIVLSASSPGAWGNALEVVVADGSRRPGAEFRLTIRLGGVLAETFDNLSMNPDASNFVGTVLLTGSRLIAATVNPTNNSTAKGTSRSGASPETALPAGNRRLTIDLHDDGPRTVTLADPVGSGAEIASAIQTAVRALQPVRTSTPAKAYSDFSATFSGGVYVLESGEGGKQSSVVVDNAATNNAARLLALGLGNGGTESTGAAELRPANGTYLVGIGTVTGTTLGVTSGSDGATPQDPDYLAALSMLDPLQDVNIVAVPGIGSTAVVGGGADYCRQRSDCFYLGEMTAVEDTVESAKTFVTQGLQIKTSHAALYFPWLTMVDPTGVDPEPIRVPPSGFVAGVYARIDARRGVWKAPAGTEANIGGATGLAASVSDAQQDTLNPIGVNVIRSFPGSGIVIWGSRTLATLSDPAYRYVPIRRLAIFLEQSIYNGIQWAVFEPNDEDLWSSLRLNIGAFMMTLFRSGAFQGNTPSKAFFVKCDGETNPQDQINAGIVTVLVGFAPLRPAEFVVIKISQKTVEAAV